MYDAIVVGASFAGLSAAMQLARARRKLLVIDAGAPRNRFAEAAHGFLGQDGADPGEIAANARPELTSATVRPLAARSSAIATRSRSCIMPVPMVCLPPVRSAMRSRYDV